MSDEQLRDETVTLLLAGHETTATSLTFTLHLLGQHPEIQSYLHTEVDRVPLVSAPLTNPKRSRLAKLMFSPDGRYLVATGYASGLLSGESSEAYRDVEARHGRRIARALFSSLESAPRELADVVGYVGQDPAAEVMGLPGLHHFDEHGRDGRRDQPQ